MAKTTTKLRDRNRFVKKSPFRRRQPNFALETEAETIVEAILLDFDGSESETHNFKASFPGVPVVTATALINDGNVNVWVSSVSADSVTVAVSDGFTGQVAVQAIFIRS